MSLDLIEWLWDHWQELTFNALLLFILRRFIIKELSQLLRPSRTEAILSNQKIIMRVIGVEREWESNLPMNGFGITLPQLSKKLCLFSPTVMNHPKKRRKTKMNSNINFLTLIPTLAMALKLILQVFGIQIPDENVNAVVNVISSIGAVIGVYLPHTKAAAISETVVQALPDIQNTIHKVIADPNTSYAKMVPVINEVHKTLTTLFEDMQTGRVTDATREAMSAYLTFQAYLQTVKPTPPIQVTTAIPSAEKVGA